MKAEDLINIINTKTSPNDEIEFVICRPDGEIIAMDIANNAKDLVSALKLFGK